MVRADAPDTVYKTEEAKFKAIARDVKERNRKGQPVLIGTVSIAKNEQLAEHLRKEGVNFEVLNAKNHEREAQIIAQAGRLGSVTLATNIAGRGVDILLGGNPVDAEEAAQVRGAGGLHILGTERHESRRIDNQLRGRAGRQGDPGSSQFFVSMEDDLMRLFGGERMKNLMERLGIPDDQPIEAKLVSRSIESAQKKIEGLNFDTRKSVLEYDDVLNLQRTRIYRQRRQYLTGEGEQNLKEDFLGLIREDVTQTVTEAFGTKEVPAEALEEIIKQVNGIYLLPADISQRLQTAIENAADREFAVIDALYQGAADIMEAKEQEMGAETHNQVLRFLALQAVDVLWMEHLDTMNHLRDSVRLRGYGQRDPLVEYKREGHLAFQRLMADINKQIVYSVLKLGVQVEQHEGHQHMNVTTNLAASGAVPASAAPPADPRMAGVGRNDPCPCGSGKKYKKCGLLNTPEHQQLMAAKT